MKLQVKSFSKELDRLQKIYGDPGFLAIYGAGCIKNPKLFFLLMNPTGKNISAQKSWSGLRMPWLGTKNIWKLLFKLDLLSKETFEKTQKLKMDEWTSKFSIELYRELAKNKVYLTSLGKCTQKDARPLPNKVFQAYLLQTLREIKKVNPQYIISFGNQVSSIILNKLIRVSDYSKKSEVIFIQSKKFLVFPTFYPVGQGLRNMDKAVKRIKKLR